MDENVEGAITRALRLLGVDALTVQEDGREGLEDPRVLDRAEELGRILFSRDSDLIAEAVLRLRRGEAILGVIYAHKEKVALSLCIQDLEIAVKTGTPEDFENRVYYLPLT